MITIILTIIIVFLILFSLIDYYDTESISFCIIISVLFGGVFGTLIAGLLPSKTEIVKENYILEKFNDNTGDFFIGITTIESKTKYVFFYKDKDKDSKNKNYKMMFIDYDNVGIYCDSITPRVEKITQKDSKCFRNYFAFDVEIVEYKIYIPEKTIKHNYLLNKK